MLDQANTNSGNAGRDNLTGLLYREAFLPVLDAYMKSDPTPAGGVVFFDVQRFKLVNSNFGAAAGDRLLRFIGEKTRAAAARDDLACRFGSDRFVFLAPGENGEVVQRVETLFDQIAGYGLPMEILCNAGIYLLEGYPATASIAVDSAIMAQKVVKGSYSRRYHFFDEALRKNLLGEQEIITAMRPALEERQFLVYYQPQYNYATGMLVGAEALVRWLHPEKGLIPPGQFIPVFESNGFVTEVDRYVFQTVCAFQRRMRENGVKLAPVSVNLTRYDLFRPGFLEELEQIRDKSGVPAKYIRIEITESSSLGNSRFINDALKTLHGFGYTVEMDDFGSGYSSLNTLKDIDFDVIKLDTRFFQNAGNDHGRGGTILSSVVRMMNWLQLPMIAEGIERREQAEFLRSIGCNVIQGYLFSKPLPEAEFEHLLRGSRVGAVMQDLRLIENIDAQRFWSSDSLETLIFSNYVGGACIFEYDHKRGKTEMLRLNRKYLQELGMNLSEGDLIGTDILENLDDTGRKSFQCMLERGADTGEEQECESWRTITSSCCGQERICIRTTARSIGRNRDKTIFYSMIRNITAEKERFSAIQDSERRFKAASEQVNIYYWEYTVATHEMRPCFRCMRDLGLPALMTNYPDSAIEMGVFPPEVADMYREWHRKIDAGELDKIEAILPLTVGRIPFHVRYTTEFDESGNAVKAYGSAALVVDGAANRYAC